MPNPFFGQITNGPLSGPTVSRAQLLRPFPHFGDVIAVNSTWGSSTYHALQVSIERRLSAGLSLTASYTWSKLIDDVTGPFAGDTLSGMDFQNNNNLKAEHSVSSLDLSHRFVVGYVWHLPLGGHRLLQHRPVAKVLSGWQIAQVLWGSCSTTFMESGNYRRAMDFVRPIAPIRPWIPIHCWQMCADNVNSRTFGRVRWRVTGASCRKRSKGIRLRAGNVSCPCRGFTLRPSRACLFTLSQPQKRTFHVLIKRTFRVLTTLTTASQPPSD